MTLTKRLLSLIKNGNCDKVKSTLENSDLDESLATLGAALLRYSARHGNVDVARYLVTRGCDVNAQDSKGRTALMRALEGRHHEIVAMLLAKKAATSITNRANRSALHLVCADHNLSSELRFLFLQKFRGECSGSEDVAEKLIDAGCHLYQAVYIKDAKIVERMLERGAPTDSMIPTAKITALHIAVLLEDVQSVKVLLRYGADAKAMDLMGYSPVFYVYRCTKDHSAEKVEILRMLLAKGVSVANVVQLRPALTNGSAEVIRTVLSSRDFTDEDAEDNGALHCLAANRNPGVVDELELHVGKCRVNALAKSGLSPLHMSAIYGNVPMVKFLLERGAEVNRATYTRGRTALYYAYARAVPDFERDYDECVELLLEHGADPQFVVTEELGEVVTVFDLASRHGRQMRERLQSVIAKLAMMEETGTRITETTRARIGSRGRLKRYYDRCRGLLGREIHGSVTLLKLLNARERSLERYAGNEELVSKLNRISRKQAVRSSFRYYHDTLVKRFSKGIQRRRLTDGAARGICEIFGGRVDRTHVVVGKVTEYLNDQDLRQLCLL